MCCCWLVQKQQEPGNNFWVCSVFFWKKPKRHHFVKRPSKSSSVFPMLTKTIWTYLSTNQVKLTSSEGKLQNCCCVHFWQTKNLPFTLSVADATSNWQSMNVNKKHSTFTFCSEIFVWNEQMINFQKKRNFPKKTEISQNRFCNL